MNTPKLTQILGAAIVCAFLSLSTACGSGGMIADAEKIADEMCACKDAACLEEVGKKASKMQEKYKDMKDKKPSEDDMKKLMAVAEKMQKCTAKIVGGAAAPATE